MSQGYISEIVAKDTRAGKMYDFVIDGRKIGAGKFPPKGFQAGDYVEYGITENGNFLNLTPGSMKKLAAPQGVAAPASPTANAAKTTAGGAFSSYDSKQDTIARQAAANTALALMQVMVAADALPVPKTGKNKTDIVEAVFREYTAKIYQMSTGNEYKHLDGEGGDVSEDVSPAPAQSWDE